MFKRSAFSTIFILCIVSKFAYADINCFTQTYIPQIECEALVSFYNSTNGAAWSDNTGWLTDSDPHNWHGVSCNNVPCDGGNIQTLYLPNNQLSGIIPPEIGDLSILQYLYLDNNQLGNSIPDEIGNLSNLRYLYLYENQLIGPIPSEIENLSNLQYLSLYGNQLIGPIPSEIGNLSNLQSLSLGNNQLTGPIPSEIGNLSNLQSLTLGNNQLSGPVPLPVAQLGASLGAWCYLNNNNELCIPDITEYQEIGADLICSLPLSHGCILQGDLNGDGTMDLKDIIVGLRMLAGSISENILIFSDVDGNDQIGMGDVLYSLAEIAK